MSALALPARAEEAWRWADLSGLPALAEARPSGRTPPASDWLLEGAGPRLVFVDGVLDAAASRPAGLAIGPVSAVSGHALGQLTRGATGWTLTLAADAAPAGPIEIVHLGSGGASHVPAEIRLADGAQASLVESFAGHGWANRFTAIRLGQGARLMRAVRIAQADGFVSLRDEAQLGAGASLVTVALGAGGGDLRFDAEVTLGAPEAFAEVGGALLTRGRQRQEAAVVLRHAAAAGQSRQTWRAVAADQAVASLAARVEVARDAQQTDGEQSLRGLLLDRTATINLKPELEIFADDVKCAHGATVGELDAQALFYCQSRGIPRARARGLLTRAFVADALDRIGEAAVREAFRADAEAWLEAAL
ncbi:SufB/SufD family protein [Sphingomonas morindae]|uniref:SufD family Fe-S cluster assembly protein n=1 Tax=Sphingomonas morindae TaxID=1541170 RepID=A0ABY4XBI6_9SPHN|nr:SufD family Fe-S cluster assembly protein [Sphingomonas morindae]USI74335.1 SufD family Fe-S cluster assembly protein [Sphingomonas morindae]